MRVTHTTDEMESLCDFCDRSYEYPACCPDYVEFGDGIGGDNIVTCGNFLELEKKTVPELVKLRKVVEAAHVAVAYLQTQPTIQHILVQALAELDKEER